MTAGTGSGSFFMMLNMWLNCGESGGVVNSSIEYLGRVIAAPLRNAIKSERKGSCTDVAEILAVKLIKDFILRLVQKPRYVE